MCCRRCRASLAVTTASACCCACSQPWWARCSPRSSSSRSRSGPSTSSATSLAGLPPLPTPTAPRHASGARGSAPTLCSPSSSSTCPLRSSTRGRPSRAPHYTPRPPTATTNSAAHVCARAAWRSRAAAWAMYVAPISDSLSPSLPDPLQDTSGVHPRFVIARLRGVRAMPPPCGFRQFTGTYLPWSRLRRKCSSRRCTPLM
mmetsp:Transcript_27195/g.64288  ORF Transcript_27195/g.64288 Transcript_27195/m.64288 type:complete len:202 (+) Transcript_27195:92-697(+)